MILRFKDRPSVEEKERQLEESSSGRDAGLYVVYRLHKPRHVESSFS